MRSLAWIGAGFLALLLVLYGTREEQERRRPSAKEVAPVPEKASSTVTKEEPLPKIPEETPKMAAASDAIVDVRQLLRELANAFRLWDDKRVDELLKQLLTLFVPPPVPDDENAALVYREAFDLLKKADYSSEMGKAVSRFEMKTDLTDDDWAFLGKWLEENQGALRKLGEAGQKPLCRFPFEYERGAAAIWADAGKALDASRLLRLEAVSAQRTGDAERYGRALLSLGQLSGFLRREPLLLAQLVGMVSSRRAVEEIRNASLETLVAFAEGSRVASASPAYAQAVLYETYSSAKVFRDALKGEKPLGNERTYEYLSDPIRRQDAGYFVDLMSEVYSVSDRPYYEIKGRLETLNEQILKISPDFAVGTREFAPLYLSLRNQIASREAWDATIQVAARLKNYKERNGSYPGSLGALGGALPPDPFTGEPLRYRLDGEGFQLWSARKGESEETLQLRGEVWKSDR